MKSGYKIKWTDHALSELKETINYLETFWTENDVSNFSKKLEHTIQINSLSPEIFPVSNDKPTIRKAVVEKHNTLYYRIIEYSVEIVSLFSTIQNSDKKKL